MTEKEKFIEFVRKEMANGLLDIHISWRASAADANEEELFGELNKVVNSPKVEDKELI